MSLSHKPPYLQSPLYNVSLYKLTSVSIQAYGANFATYNKYKLTTVSIQASGANFATYNKYNFTFKTISI